MSSLTVPARDLRNRYAELLRAVEGGAIVTITSRGRPVARMVPVSERPSSLPGAALNAILAANPLDGAFLTDVRPPDAERVLDGLGE